MSTRQNIAIALAEGDGGEARTYGAIPRSARLAQQRQVKTALTNRLQALLKSYFPQASELCGEDLWRPLATDFLRKWGGGLL